MISRYVINSEKYSNLLFTEYYSLNSIQGSSEKAILFLDEKAKNNSNSLNRPICLEIQLDLHDHQGSLMMKRLMKV